MKSFFFKIFRLVSLLLIICTGVSWAQEQSSPTRNTDHPVHIRAVPDSIADSMKKEKEFIYANDPSFWKKNKQKENTALIKWLESVAGSPLLKWALYFFLATAIIFVLYQVVVVNDFFIFSRKGKKNNEAAGNEEELFTENIDEKINAAIAAGEYRPAIRFLFLKTLQSLHDKNRIRLHSKATNQDYIQQMKNPEEAKEFKMLTGIYEYVWYGEFQPDKFQFELIRSNFNKFIANH